MASRYSKRTVSSSEDGSSSGSSTGREDEKTIPFLRRLRDMLLENGDVISFLPGYYNPDQNVLGQIVVHDRVSVEARVLPRYFNHSSFASLRRQLNYFSFVRMGKGRQRESTYVNEGVVKLDDILHLKRRSAGSGAVNQEDVLQKARVGSVISNSSCSSNTMPLGEKSGQADNSAALLFVHASGVIQPPRKKRRRITKPAFRSPRTMLPVNVNNVSSDEENSESKHSVGLDLTAPKADAEILAGCNALLGLTGKGWN